MNLNAEHIIKMLTVYILESFAITLIVFILAKKSLSLQHLSWLFITIASILLALDLFAPEIGLFARQGQGFSAGLHMIGGSGSEGFYSYSGDDQPESSAEVLPYTKDILSTY